MAIAIECVDCGFSARVKDHLAGRVVECPKCKAGLRVPDPGAAPVAARAPSRATAPKPRAPKALPPGVAEPDDPYVVALIVDDDDDEPAIVAEVADDGDDGGE